MRGQFMAGLVSSLIEVLKGQTELFREVIALSVDKKELIINNDIEKLKDIVKQENVIVPKLLKGDKDREKIMADISVVMNKKLEDLTLSFLSELMEGQPEHEALVKAIEEFAAAMGEMKAANDANKLLIENALDYIEFNINIIHSSLEAGPAGYGALEDNHEAGSFIDTKS
jgi:flagellar biosynthesis/type III secretory pathway chaperone